MKNFSFSKLLSLIFLIVFFSGYSQAASKWGRGDLKLSDGTVQAFIKYIKGNATRSPYKFAVSIDGSAYMYYYCDVGATCQGGDSLILEECSGYANGVECFLFASRRTIKWKNGINPGKGKVSKISRKWLDAEIKAKLTELGFLDGSTTLNTTTSSKITKKVEPKDDILSQIKSLKDLLDIGAITQDEFDKAKKKILN